MANDNLILMACGRRSIPCRPGEDNCCRRVIRRLLYRILPGPLTGRQVAGRSRHSRSLSIVGGHYELCSVYDRILLIRPLPNVRHRTILMQAVLRFSGRQSWPWKVRAKAQRHRHRSSGALKSPRSLATENARAAAPRPVEEFSLFRFLHPRRKKREASYVPLTGFRSPAGIVRARVLPR